MPSNDQIETWANAAMKVREDAEKVQSADIKQQLLDLAERYDRLVQRAKEAVLERREHQAPQR